jgi:hypothetical protein
VFICHLEAFEHSVDMSSEKEGPTVHTSQHFVQNKDDVREDVKGRDFTVIEAEIPPGYFRSLRFLGSMFAIGSAFGCGVAGFTFAAPILGYINADIGPSMS